MNTYLTRFKNYAYSLRWMGLSLLLAAASYSYVNAQNELRVAAYNFQAFTSERSYQDIDKLKSINPVSFYSLAEFGKIPFDCNAEWYEIYSKRTATTRTYLGNNGEEVYQYSYSPINYLGRDGRYLSINGRLTPSLNGWLATRQEFPAFLNADGSTEVSLEVGGAQQVKFNQHNLIDGKAIDLKNYTVGDDGMMIYNVLQGINKRMIFSENKIETDYILSKPLKNLTIGDLIISEEITLPEGYSLKEKNVSDVLGAKEKLNEYVVVNSNEEECAHFKVPACYDSKNKNGVYFGKYNLRRENGRFFLEVIISSKWLNDPSRVYPVTIDPVVTGPTTTWSGGTIPTCFYPNFQSATINITIPAGITMTNLLVSASYYADPLSGAIMHDGLMYFTTSCGRDPSNTSLYWTVPLPNGNMSGTGYLNNQNMASTIGCCVANPSCVAQTFPLTMYLGRNSGGAGCNSTYVYYNPTTSWPFQAYVVGRTVEALGTWTVAPSAICSNVCSLTINVSAQYGVPPYIMTHPWASSSATFGSHTANSCSSSGSSTLALTIPGCPSTCGAATSLSVPPPVITDACGNIINGMTPKTVALNRVPVVTATPIAVSACSGSTVNITLTSCVPSSTITWSGSNGTNGSGNISATFTNTSTTPIITNYTVNVSANGCQGSPIVVPVTIYPLPTVTAAASSPVICAGQSTTLTASGGLTYSWSPSTNLSATSGNSVTAAPITATTYTVHATDSNGCTATASTTITVNPVPVLSITPNTNICNGAAIQLSASGGTGYTWLPAMGLNNSSVPNPTANPSATTTYSVVISSVNGCTNSGMTTITVNPLPIVATCANANICNGANAQLSATGGVTYNWIPSIGLNNSTIYNPIASPSVTTAYTVSVTDVNGCTANATVTVNVNSTPQITASSNSAICSGSNVQLSSSGGISYNWNPALGLSNSTIANPVANPSSTITYTVQVIDANGCSGNVMVTVTVNPLPTVTTTANTNVCSGSNAQLSASGGTVYSWIPASSLSNANISNPMATPGITTTYTVIVADANNCVNAGTTTVTVNPLPVVAISASTSVCPGTNAQLSSGGGAIYSWIPTTGLNNAAISNPVANPAATTTYTLIVRDANGCSNSASTTVTVNPLLSITISPSTSLCLGSGTQLTSSGGTIYSWSPSVGLNNANIANPSANPVNTTTYTVHVTDANGCSGNAAVTITVNPLPTVTASAGISICAGSNTQISASGGTTYSWIPSTGLSNSNISNPTANPLAATTYTVIVADANNCVNAASTTVAVNALPTVSVSAPSAICTGFNATLTSGGGISYSWSPSIGLSNSNISNPVANPSITSTYTVFVIDANGCLNSSSTTVSVNPSLTVNATPSASICSGHNTQLTATGGMTYLWLPASGLSNSSVSNPIANPSSTTTYTVIATDYRGCTGTAFVAVNVNPLPVLTVSQNNSVCTGASIQLSASGGTTYSWSPSTGLSNNAVANPVVSPVSTTIYTVCVTDGNGCTNNGITTVTVNPLPTVSVSPNTSFCSGTSLQLTASGGLAYSWSPGAGLSDPTISSPRANPTVTTTYTVNVTDINGCSASNTVTINVLASVQAAASPDVEICDGQSTLLYGSGGQVYLWTPTIGLSNPAVATPVASPKTTTTYTVAVSNPGSACPPSTAATTVTVHPPPLLFVSTDTTIMEGTAITLSASGSGISYQWMPVTDMSCAMCSSPLANPATSTTYTVNTLDIYGCSASDTVRISIKDVLTLYLPNAFAPFSDRGNSIFRAYTVGAETFELYIFDRWGNVLFQSNDQHTGWDGTYKGLPVQQDAYVYLARAQSFSGKTITKGGAVTVLK